VLGAILYRHWLELRFRILATLGPWIVLCGASALAAVQLSPTVPASLVYAWALSIAVLIAGLVFGGTGIRPGPEAAPRSVYFTLTLPVSRLTLASTRLVVAGALAVTLVLGVLTAVVVALWSGGQHIPFESMAASTVLGLSLAVGIQTVSGLLLPLITVRFSPVILSLSAAGAILAIGQTLNDSSAGWSHVVRFLEFQPAQWDVLGLLLVVIAASLAAATVLVRIKEF